MTRDVREELAHVEVSVAVERRAEAAALCRFSGSLHVRGADDPGGSRPCWVTSTTSGAVARRLHRILVEDVGIRPGIEVYQPGGLRPSTDYRLVVPVPLWQPERDPGAGQGPPGSADDPTVGFDEQVGGPRVDGPWVVDSRGRPLPEPPELPSRAARRGWLRGAAMATMSVSRPGRAAHLEMAAPGDLEADAVVEILAELGATSARVIRRALRDGRVRHRVVVKSGEQIGVVLAGLGAHRAFLERDLRRLERGLRSEANRAANADRANLDRAATAAARQVAAINAALDRLEPDSLPDDIRQTALARIANPGATLGQVGALLDPPVGRSAVHRRIRRLLATGATDAAEPASTAD